MAGLKHIVTVMLESLPTMINAILVCSFCILIFSVFAVSFLKGTFYSCKGDMTQDQLLLVTFPVSWENLNQSQQELFTNTSCSVSEVYPKNPTSHDICNCWPGTSWSSVLSYPNSFNNVISAFFTLYEMATVSGQIQNGYSVLGEVDHPDDLKVNLDRVSHMITNMWMEGPNGYGKMKILPTPMGNLVRTMLESGVKLGVSSRGSGNVNDMNGHVSDFEIITVDVVAQPSAPGAYPTPVYEHLMNTRGGMRAFKVAQEVKEDPKAQKYLQESLLQIIKGLK